MKTKKDTASHDSYGSERTTGLGRGESALSQLIGSATFQMKRNELNLVKRYKNLQQNIKVSIIMPTWNRGFIIKRAVDSVLSQTYRNFELVICDDGSTDGTYDLIAGTYAHDNRVKLLSGEHLGVCHARNHALAVSQGSLLAYLDSDNQWEKNYLLLMVNSFIDNKDAKTMYCGVRVINNVRGAQFTRLVDYDRKALVERNYIDMNIFMHERSLLSEMGAFRLNLAPLEDWELILRYTKKYPPFMLNCCLAKYYIEKNFDHQTVTQDIMSSYRKIRKAYQNE